MKRWKMVALSMGMLLVIPSCLLAAPPAGSGGGEASWLGAGQTLAVDTPPKQVEIESKLVEVKKDDLPGLFDKLFRPPQKAFVPMHSFEGYSGGLVTPTAYIINQDHKGWVGMPSVSYTYAHFDNDDRAASNSNGVVATVPFLNRFELGYGGVGLDAGRFLSRAAEEYGIHFGRDGVWLHSFSLRGNVLRENEFGCPYVPALTVGVTFKHNEGIAGLDHAGFGSLRRQGMGTCGTDWTLVLSKQVEDPWLHRPVVGSVGMRITDSEQAGAMGFVDTCTVSPEANLFYKPLDWLTLGYEFRRMQSRYHKHDLSPLLERDRQDQDWHVFSIGFNVTEGVQVVGFFGGLETLGLQVKVDF